MPRQVYERRKDFRYELFSVRNKMRKTFCVVRGVCPQRLTCRLDRPVEDRRRLVVEWMRERRGRLDPLQAVFSKRKTVEKRRSDSQRMDGGTNVVNETRLR